MEPHTLPTLPTLAIETQPCVQQIDRILRWVPIRTFAARHRQRVLAHLLALDDSDRSLRFGHFVGDERLRRYAAQLDFDRDQIFGTFDRSLTLVAMGHLALDASQGTGELGLSVLAPARGRGLGTQLFEHAVMHARNRGVHTLYIHLAHHNTPMLAIVQRAGARLAYEDGETHAELSLEGDTVGTQIGELLGHQAAELDFHVKLQTLRLDALTRIAAGALQTPNRGCEG